MMANGRNYILVLSLKVVDDFQDQQLGAVARALLNHGAQPLPPEVVAVIKKYIYI